MALCARNAHVTVNDVTTWSWYRVRVRVNLVKPAPSLVGDRGGQVLRVLGWALTRIRNLSLVLRCGTQGS